MATAQLDRAQRSYNRTQVILEKNPGALSQADVDRTETSLAQAVERLSAAEADLDKAKEQLGITGPVFQQHLYGLPAYLVAADLGVNSHTEQNRQNQGDYSYTR